MDDLLMAARIGSLLGFVAAVAFEVWRFVRRRRAHSAETGKGHPASYSSEQWLGIAGIVFVLLPVLLGVALNLGRGMVFLASFVMAALRLPDSVVLWLLGPLHAASVFMALVFAFFLCREVWPTPQHDAGVS